MHSRSDQDRLTDAPIPTLPFIMRKILLYVQYRIQYSYGSTVLYMEAVYSKGLMVSQFALKSKI